ncbi:H+transporting two-sector ATPase B/B' subunit [Denitrovibrio acetiphilus DSM 12809]|uniref:ATP synthase subunit b n=1 Tax=Denitrovibrio acetiphilus (strain DSM 12809 / NBRC 114555 / N2460) TaxID=522772 RepID=D4H613_DENA2|nr:H+transporting two-sector ATPase subunit B/B' [Denitrovibrio acetiphilus]ADD67659.1 H+transporting two-sector ATPase B/B' subunit [Denitrovibrio acetiphilus DSM 12809]
MKKVLATLTLAMVSFTAFAAEHGGEHAVDMTALWKNFGYRVIVFVVLVAIIVKLAKKPLLNFLDKRTADIEKAIADANDAAEYAKAELTNYEIKMEGFEKDLETMKEKSLKAAEAEKELILEDAARQIEKLQAFAENAIASETKKATVTLKREAVLAAIEAAEAKLGSKLDEATQKKLLEQYIKKMEVAG